MVTLRRSNVLGKEVNRRMCLTVGQTMVITQIVSGRTETIGQFSMESAARPFKASKAERYVLDSSAASFLQSATLNLEMESR